LETEKVGTSVRSSGHNFGLLNELGGSHLVVLVVEVLDVLGIELFVLADILLDSETLGLGLLGCHVIIKGETNFFLNNGLRLGLLTGLALTSGLFFLGFFNDFTVFTPVSLSVTTFLVATSATAGSVLSVHRVGILTGLTFELVATATASFSALGTSNLLTVLTNSGHSGSGSVTTAATSTVTTTLSVTTGSVSTTATVTTATTASITTTAATRGTTALSLGSVFDFLELLTVLNGGLGDLDDDLLLGLGGLGGNLGLLNLSGDLFFVGECSESV